jgi:uncharacterized protein
MNAPLMPKATAVWLIENTTLTFDQIAGFCGLHPLEIQGIADGEVAKGIVGIDPVTNGQLSVEEIKRCEQDEKLALRLSEDAIKHLIVEQKSHKGGKYTPVARRQDKPEAVAWLLKNCPELLDSQITKLIGTTKATIDSIRNKTHWNAQNIKPKDPVLLGLCSQTELDKIYSLAKKKAESKNKDDVTQELNAKLAE